MLALQVKMTPGETMMMIDSRRLQPRMSRRVENYLLVLVACLNQPQLFHPVWYFLGYLTHKAPTVVGWLQKASPGSAIC